MVFEIFSANGNARRREFIDTANNELYKPTDNAKDVERKYLAFWGISKENKGLRCIAYPVPQVKPKGECWGVEIEES